MSSTKTTTYHLDINPITSKALALFDLHLQCNEVAQLHTKLIKSNKCLDKKFLHEALYKECRKRFPKLPANTIQLIRNEIIERFKRNPDLYETTVPILLSAQSFKITKSVKSTHFDAWVKINGVSYPLEGKEIIKKLTKLGLITYPQYGKKYEKQAELNCLIAQQEIDLAEGHKRVVKLRNQPTRDNKIVRGFIKRKNNKWKFFLVVETTLPPKTQNIPIYKETEYIKPLLEENKATKIEKVLQINNKRVSSPVYVIRVKDKLPLNINKLFTRPIFIRNLIEGIKNKQSYGYYLLHNMIASKKIEALVYNYV